MNIECTDPDCPDYGQIHEILVPMPVFVGWVRCPKCETYFNPKKFILCPTCQERIEGR